MRTSEVRSAVAFLLLGSLLLCSFNARAADDTEQPKKPSDFILPELALGSFTAAVGWGVSALASLPFRGPMGCKENPATFYWCALLWVAGPSLGAPIGVIAVGELSGVQGNNPFAVLGGLFAGLTLFSCVSDPRGWGATAWCQALYLGGFGLAVVPALFATIGYNLPARMKADFRSSVRWTLRLFATRF